MAICAVGGCEGKTWAAGLCSRHYNRKCKTGTTDDGPRARLPFEQRLWRNVEKRGRDQCWPWIGKSRTAGYGYIGLGGRDSGKVLAHRAAWESAHGPIPIGRGYHGTVILHTCDNRLCCNPAHLRMGTQAENVADMDAKGRRKTVAYKGERHHNARFTESDIRYIRASTKSNAELGRKFGCARQVIGGIRNRRSWRHIA